MEYNYVGVNLGLGLEVRCRQSPWAQQLRGAILAFQTVGQPQQGHSMSTKGVWYALIKPLAGQVLCWENNEELGWSNSSDGATVVWQLREAEDWEEGSPGWAWPAHFPCDLGHVILLQSLINRMEARDPGPLVSSLLFSFICTAINKEETFTAFERDYW